jgi:AhpD family alkylhydroperoxidase
MPHEPRMSRIAPVDPATAKGRAKELLDEVQSRLGATPNMTKLMAGSAVLEGWLRFEGALRRGSIRLADGERIALGTADANRCVYCLSAHSEIAAGPAKLDAGEIERRAGSGRPTRSRPRSSRSPPRSCAATVR